MSHYICLGQVISADPNHEKEIKPRISMGWAALGKNSDILSSKLTLVTKKKKKNWYTTNVLFRE